jgi:uncharacterized membrane protein
MFYTTICIAITWGITRHLEQLSSGGTHIKLLLSLAILPNTKSNYYRSTYPFLAWLPILLWGMMFGRLNNCSIFAGSRKKVAHLGIGILLLFGFAVVHFQSAFMITKNQVSNSSAQDWVSMMTLVKYPPSISFILFTMGVNHIILFLIMQFSSLFKWQHLLVFGKTSLFFYVLHFWIYGLMVTGGSMLGIERLELFPLCQAWVTSIFVMYPMCRWYLAFRTKRGKNSIWRHL